MRLAPSFAIVTAIAHSLTAFGALYVITPTTQSVCHGGKPCLVQWLDDGQNPLLATMGPCHVGLFSGNEKLIQQIEPVDVSTSHSLTFTPSPNAGPNSSTYYVQFTSVTTSNSSLVAFSPNFSLDNMTGSFNSPVPELTSTIPVPPSVLSAHSNQISTSLFGTISSTSTSTSSPTRSHASSSTPSSGTPSPSSTSPRASTTTSASANAATQHFSQLWAVGLAGLPFLFLV